MKKALITGINGQDGSYLAELLLEKGYEVHGILKRHSETDNQTSRIDHIIDDINLYYADVTDMSSIINIVNKVDLDEIYNLAGQSQVKLSFDQPRHTANVNGLAIINILDAIKEINPKIKLCQASSSEMFGNNLEEDGFQRETTLMSPVSPYGSSKLFAYSICRNYRHAYNIFASNAILFNHESPRRGATFVSNKITKEVAKIKLGLSNKLVLGNLESSRDWGHAKDYVNAMHSILQLESPDDFVCATGTAHSVRDLCKCAFEYIGLNYEDYVVTDKELFRPKEIYIQKGDSTKLKKLTGWKTMYTFETMVQEMVEHWINYYKNK